MLSWVALALVAADLNGFWTGQIRRDNADPVDVAFQFTQRGFVVGGKLYNDFRSQPVIEGKLDGELLSFVVVVPEQAGNEINQTRYRFTGRFVGSELELTRERESSTRAGSRGGVEARQANKLTFRVKRI